jgi:hypothetical protein
LQEAGLEIEMMFRRVAQDVTAQTRGRQRPETTISLLSEYYLNQWDQLAWEKIKDSDDPAAFRSFAKQFPSSALALSAKSRLDIIDLTARAKQESARQQQELARLTQEQLAREIAELERIERERAKREAPASPPAASGPSLEGVAWNLVRDSRDAEQLRRFLQQFPQSTRRGEAEQRMAALGAEAAQLTRPPPTPQLDSAEITRSMQLELKRVGCFDGAVNGEFGSTTRAALANFAKLAALTLPQQDPSPDALKAIRGFDKRVCPLVCQAGERVEGERCIRIVCPAGKVLEDGTCVAKADTEPPRRTPPNPEPRSRAAAPSRAPAGDATAESLSIRPAGDIPSGTTVVLTSRSGRTMTCIGGHGASGRRCTWN